MKVQITFAHVIPATPEVGSMSAHEYLERLRDQTWGLLPMRGQDLASSFENIPTEYKNISRSFVYGDLSDCSENVHVHRLTHTQSLCPVQWVNNTDVINRKPSSLLEAKCVCGTRRLHGIDIICRPVTSYVTVFRRRSHSGQYFKSYEPLIVSCVAMVTPPVSHIDNTPQRMHQ